MKTEMKVSNAHRTASETALKNDFVAPASLVEFSKLLDDYAGALGDACDDQAGHRSMHKAADRAANLRGQIEQMFARSATGGAIDRLAVIEECAKEIDDIAANASTQEWLDAMTHVARHLRSLGKKPVVTEEKNGDSWQGKLHPQYGDHDGPFR